MGGWWWVSSLSLNVAHIDHIGQRLLGHDYRYLTGVLLCTQEYFTFTTLAVGIIMGETHDRVLSNLLMYCTV